MTGGEEEVPDINVRALQAIAITERLVHEHTEHIEKLRRLIAAERGEDDG